MSLMVTCPTCQVMLRVPLGAETIRCPQCKVVLALQTETVPPPPPEPVKPAIPLPFARPPVAPRPEPARQAEPPRGKTIRGKFVDEHEDIDAEELSTVTRRRERRELTDDEKLERRMERVAEEIQPARVGMKLLGLASIAAGIAPLGVALYFVSTLFMPSGDNFFILLPIIGAGCHWLLAVAGFGFCCFGPKDMRFMAISGVVVMILHALAILGLVQLTLGSIKLANAGFAGINEEPGLISAALLANIFNNMSGVANIPMFVHFGLQNSIGGLAFVVLLIAGAFEFSKLTLVGILANHYAIEGKAPELAHRSIRFVYRLFWVVIVGFIGELIIVGSSHLGFGFVFLSLPSMMLMNAYFLWCAFSWIAQYQVLNEVLEVMTPERITDKRANLDMY